MNTLFYNIFSTMMSRIIKEEAIPKKKLKNIKLKI